MIWAIDLPGDFASGNGTVRLYIDDAASPEEQRELEAIFMGQRGGPWEVIAGIVTKWLPTRVLPITVTIDKEVEIKARDIGCIRLAPLVSASGEPVRIINPPGFAPFEIGEIQAAYCAGTGWWDNEMRRWEATAQGWGSVSRFSWSA